ncbi:MAG: TRAP transporter small permease [Hyphomicrobiales bacterium]|nr:MAG: TRAP transporter small permease [Hyphomicrobiales bacterium]
MSIDKETGAVSAGPVFDILAGVTRIATGTVLIALVILVCGEAFLRGAFNYSFGFAEEVTGYFVVMLTFFGAALALRRGALFQVNFLFGEIPGPARIWLKRLFIVAALFVCAVLAWKTYGLMLSSLERGKFAPTVLRTPLWIPQLLMPAGFAVLGLFLLEQLLLTARKFGKPN